MYKLNQSEIVIEEKRYITYGISCGNISICDISTDKKRVSALIAKCNKGTADILHIYDIIEDFLTGRSPV